MSTGEDQPGRFSGFGGFGSFKSMGESMRKQAEELAKSAASQVSDINSKLVTTPGPKTPSNGSEADPSTTTPMTTETPATAMKSPENISKEELLDVLQKMNKKVKALTALRSQLADRVKSAEADKDRLIKLVTDEILGGEIMIQEGEDPVEQLQKAWHQVDERNSLALQGLQAEYKAVAMQCKEEVDQVKRAAEAGVQAEVEKVRANVAAETLANGNEAWEIMREQLTQRHQEEAQLLRKELHEQYDFQLAQKEEEFNARLTETIERTRADMEEKFAARVASQDVGSNENVEAIKAHHAQEMAKLKEAAAGQLQALKKKVAAFRSAEIEKIKKETIEAKDAEMRVRLDELTQRYEDQIESLRSESSVVPMGPPTEEELERLKSELQTSHLEELESVKQRIAKSLEETQQETLEELRLQRENELRSVKAEIQALSDAQIQQARVDLENEFNEKLNVLQHTHARALENASNELRRHVSELQNENHLLKTQLEEMESIVESYKSETEENKNQYEANLEKVKMQLSSQLETQLRTRLQCEFDEKILVIQSEAAATAKLSLEQVEAQHQVEIEAIRKEALLEMELLQRNLTNEHVLSMEKLQAELDAKLEAAVLRAVQDASTTAEYAKASVSEKYEADLRALKQDYDAALSKTALETETKADARLLALRTDFSLQMEEMQAKENSLLEKVRALADIETTLKEANEKYEREIKNLQHQNAQELETLRSSLTEDFNQTLEKIKQDAASDLEHALASAQQKAEHANKSLKSALEVEKESIIDELRRESELALIHRVDEEKALALVQLDSLRVALSEELNDMRKREKELIEKVRSSESREESLLSELHSLKSTMDAIEKDRIALSEAAQSGESSVKMFEERLTAQRASFDASMVMLKDQFATEKEQFYAKEHNLVACKENLEHQLNDTRQRSAELEALLDSTKSTLQNAQKESELKMQDYENRLASIAEGHLSEITKLKEEVVQLQSNHAVELERALSSAVEQESHLQTSLDDANTAIKNLKEELESERVALINKHELALNEAREQINERDIRMGKLIAQIDNLEKNNCAMSAELGAAQTRLVQLETEANQLRKSFEAAESSLSNLAAEQLSEKEALVQSFEQELKKTENLVHEREQIIQELLGKVRSADELYDATSVDLETARKRLSHIESDSRDVQEALKRQVSKLENERNILVEKLAQAANREEAIVVQHQESMLGIMKQLETDRQGSSERETVLQEKMDQLLMESQAEVQKLSEEVELLKETIASLKSEHEDSLREKGQSYSRSLAESEARLADTVLSMEAEKQKAFDALKQDFESKLTEARDKQLKAMELVKKLKAATTAKLQGIEKDRIAEKSIFEDQLKNLENTLREEYNSRITALVDEHTTLTKELESNQFKKDEEYQDSLARAADDWKEKLSQTIAEHTERASLLQDSLEEAQRQLQNASSDEVERVFEAKVKVLHEQYEEQLNSMECSHATALENEKQKIAQLLVEHEKALARIEAANVHALEEFKKEKESCLDELKSKHDEDKKIMQDKLAKHVDDLTLHFQEKAESSTLKHNEEIQSLRDLVATREDQIAKITRQLNDVRNEFVNMEKQHDALQTKFSSEVVVKQALQKKIEELQKQLAESTANGAATAQSLLQQQEVLELRVVTLDEEVKRSMHERDVNKNKIEELRGKLDALGANLSVTLDEKNKLEAELQDTSRKASKLDQAEQELNALRDQLNTLKLEQAKSNSLLEKLQAEKEANTRSHGQRTALVGMLEEQLADLNEKNSELNAKLQAAMYDLSSRDEDIQQLQESLENAQKEIADVQNARKHASESLSSAQKGVDAKKGKMIETLQKEIHSLQQQMAKKSTAAQKLIQQREAECIELRKTTKALQHELDKGSLSDRRIFELAAQQSNRESVAVSEIEVRDQMVDKLTVKLQVQDADLAEAEYSVKKYENQVEELCRIRRRDDVNLDYLKSIVVQYLSKPPGSSEREALLPVLATLLQFDSNDYKTIEDGKNKLSWWGNVAPILITPPTPKPPLQEHTAPLLSAEISVSRTTSADASLNNRRSRTTSLEF